MQRRYNQRRNNSSEGSEFRVRLPRDNQILGVVELRVGYGHSRIVCADGKTRLCKVPGHLKRALWVRQDNIVLVEPLEIGGDKKGYIIYKYAPNQVDWLREKGYLAKLIEKEEF